MPLSDHAAHWANYLGELVRELPMHYPSWRQIGMRRLPSRMIPRTLPGVLKIAKPSKEQGRMPAGIPVTCCHSRSDDGELRYSRVPVADPDLLLDTHCWRGSNIKMGVPYIEDEIMAIVRNGKQRGHLPGVGRVFPGQDTNVLSPPPPRCTHNYDVVKLKNSNTLLTKQPEFGSGSGSGGCGDDESGDDEDDDEDEEDADN
uniref:Uncharacterized protein n=1 Tax=Tanacetum cinerariifolium TaxID=118510 RepID=A0A699GZ03_TANCI|nr:hypothetical protein [Tanacetum cinerariifolium]